jgi:hypothetical protein
MLVGCARIVGHLHDAVEHFSCGLCEFSRQEFIRAGNCESSRIANIAHNGLYKPTDNGTNSLGDSEGKCSSALPAMPYRRHYGEARQLQIGTARSFCGATPRH